MTKRITWGELGGLCLCLLEACLFGVSRLNGLRVNITKEAHDCVWIFSIAIMNIKAIKSGIKSD
jgi:hypothetical protein